MISPDAISRFATFAEEQVAVTAVALELVLYFDTELYSSLESITELLGEFELKTTENSSRFYRSESMRNFKPTKSHPAQFVAKWSSGARKDYRHLSYFYDDPLRNLNGFSFALENATVESSYLEDDCNYVRFVFPPDFATDEFQKFSLRCAEALPYRSGHGGYSIQKSLYERNRAMDQALRYGLRYIALDISDLGSSGWAVRRDCIKGIYWLTMIGKDLAERLQLRIDPASFDKAGCEVTTVPSGFVIQCGEHPILGDRNRGESLEPYIAAYQLLKPAMAKLVDSHPPFSTINNLDAEEITEKWLMRLRDVSEQ